MGATKEHFLFITAILILFGNVGTISKKKGLKVHDASRNLNLMKLRNYQGPAENRVKNKHLQKSTAARLEQIPPHLSTPEECARDCKENEDPKTCYYHFTMEMYTVLGAACQLCWPNSTDSISSSCQCVLADGVEKAILTANRMIPGPSIQVCEGDKVVIDVLNKLEGVEVAIHWHGVWQTGSQYYDGVPFVTQCPIHQGNTFRYQWSAGNAGTHFWHSHAGLQEMDGLHGGLVIRQVPSKDPNSGLYDFDLTWHVVVLSDWLHELAGERFPGAHVSNLGQDPESLLINGKGQFRAAYNGSATNTPLEVFRVTQGKRYRFRMINAFSSVCPAQLNIEGHRLILIATDGVAVKPVSVNTIISFTGERYDFVINANQPSGAYWIQVKALGECGIGRVQQLAVLQYGRGSSRPVNPPPTYDNGIPQGVVLNPLDARCEKSRPNAVCISQLENAGNVDQGLLKPKADLQIFLPFRILYYDIDELFQLHSYDPFLVARSGGHIVALVNEISFEYPASPPISQTEDIPPEQFCNGYHRPPNCPSNCMCTHTINIPSNATVEVFLVDEVPLKNLSHPFHLHGNAFNVFAMGHLSDLNASSLKQVVALDRQGLLHRKLDAPPGKDSIAVPKGGYVIFRFRADNPGYWFFHCHFLFHMIVGMNVIFHVEGNLPPVPPNFPRCGNFKPPIL